MGIFTPSSDTSRRGQCMRCKSGWDELEHAAFQVEIYSGGRDGWTAWQWQEAAGWGGVSCCVPSPTGEPGWAPSLFRSEISSSPHYHSDLDWKILSIFISRSGSIIYKQLFVSVLCPQFVSYFFFLFKEVMQDFLSTGLCSQQFVVVLQL